MSLRTRMAKAAALVMVGALALSGCDFNVYSLPLPGGADLGDDPYAVTVEFNDVLDLVPQSAVKVDDVTVGRVEDISLDGYTAEVTLTPAPPPPPHDSLPQVTPPAPSESPPPH